MNVPTDPDDYQQLWRSAPADDEVERWDATQVAQQLDRVSRSMGARLARRSRTDVAFKALLGVLALGAAWIGRSDPTSVLLGLLCAIVALTVSGWQWRARRRLSDTGVEWSLRDALARQLHILAGIRLPLTVALASTPALVLFVYQLYYFPLEYGGFRSLRSGQLLVAVLCPMLVFALSAAVTLSRLDLWSMQLQGALHAFDEATAAAYAERLRRTRRWIAFAVTSLAVLLLAGLIVWWQHSR